MPRAAGDQNSHTAPSLVTRFTYVLRANVAAIPALLGGTIGAGIVLAFFKLYAIGFLRGLWLVRGAPQKITPARVCVVAGIGSLCAARVAVAGVPIRVRLGVGARARVHLVAVTVFALLHEFAGEALHVAVWRRLQQRMRYILLASIAITSLLIGGLLLSETLVPGFHSPLSVAVLGPVAWLLLSVQRVPLLGLSSNQLRQRFVAMVAVWLAYIVAGATWSGAKNIDGDHMGGVTLVVAFLVGSVLTAAMSAFNGYQAAPQGREH